MPPGEGLQIDGITRQLSTFALFRATITTNDGTVVNNLQLAVYQFQNGTAAFRLEDPALATLANLGIERNDIAELRIQNTAPVYYRSVGPSGHNDAFPCFVRGTMIQTPSGQRPVEALKVGDLVTTATGGAKPIRWIGARWLGARVMADQPSMRPVRIAAGALGAGLPMRDLVVSPQHRMAIRSDAAQGGAQVLVAAKHLTGAPGISICDDCSGVEYIHFMFDQHEIVLAEGALSESLYAGVQAINMLPADSRREILTLFPQLAQGALPTPAGQFLTGRQGRDLVARLMKSGKALARA